METLGERLRRKLNELGWSEGELSRRSKVKQPTIHRIMSGQSKDPRQGNIEKLAFALGVDATWLRNGKGDEARGGSNVGAPSPVGESYHYPVVSWVAAGHWSEAITPYDPGCEQSFEETDYKAKGRAFWLEVQGDSMTAPTGVSIPQGMMILVDPEVEANNGSLVVAQLAGGDEATFKKLVIDGGMRYLKPLNPSYPVIPINGNCEIVGVVVEAKMKLRFTTH
ncbi:LexA family transcriptional regulator [Halomonas sp. DP5N14-9]|uniref:LexA family protein n=1 Tax=Halomonas sp. DP5N14-9 TaxID=2859075 RepID=UPI001C995962|nr:LexA family transcriptional regulator [Halomonas sp. DP5N14-9]MBY5942802.1 LexA family transcriptional regulator [Halomonas sp. DP5N14-9]